MPRNRSISAQIRPGNLKASPSLKLGGAGPAFNGILGQEFTRHSVIYTESKLFEQEKKPPLLTNKKLQVLDDPKLRSKIKTGKLTPFFLLILMVVVKWIDWFVSLGNFKFEMKMGAMLRDFF
ncbi:hypothetical protein PIB30_035170 [Stylosanthes scabra]|uniref:Uncharacterized protein n=1 Tax=Stylosanthes scabra TaxID=79078 RepID=A0ABU6YBV1_9FABA|nr:hypothetical protein [Stylosanthes scabra]